MCFVFEYVVQFNTTAVVHCADKSARHIIIIIISSSSRSGGRNRVVGVRTHYGKDDLSSETRWGE